jgi:uncharacterized Tic20 family protein
MNPSENPPEPTQSSPPLPSSALQVGDGPSAIGADERHWAMMAHLSALLGYLLTSGWAGSAGGFLGPLIVWSMKKDTMPFVDQQGKEALNFSISICLAFAILFAFVISTLGFGLFIVWPAFIAVGLYALIFTIIASIKAYEGVAYRYPIVLRLIK